MKRKTMLWIIIGIAAFWTLLSVYANWAGKSKAIDYVGDPSAQTALIYFNPDPFYNLDEQVCDAFAEELQCYGWTTRVQTTKGVDIDKLEEADLYVFCANTYNFAPDAGIVKFVKNYPCLEGADVVAFTLGAGTTDRAHRLFLEKLNHRDAFIIADRELWLMRPNDENRMEESNVEVAKDMVRTMARNIHFLSLEICAE